jgi:mono/diheme cytochrome c family protein
VIRYAALAGVPLTVVALLGAGCSRFPEPRRGGATAIPADTTTGFNALYGENCAGCHGPDGKGGAARSLADPVFRQIANRATIRRVTAGGVPGTTMPPFAKTAGGTLTEQQIDAIVDGMRGWGSRDDENILNPPPYSTPTSGDPKRGAGVFAIFCSRCHGPDGRGGTDASSIVDPSFLSLVSNQGLRTTVIAGRPEVGAPDWRSNVPGRPMSPDDVSDVVAWLAVERQP